MSAQARGDTFKNYPGETAIFDGTGLGKGIMFYGNSVSFIKVIGLKMRNYSGKGIHFEGWSSYQGSHIEIRNNEIYDGNATQTGSGSAIWISTVWPLYGGAGNSYSDLIIDGNHVHDTYTGGNEANTISGRINRFQMTNTTIANVSFIGMDVIGKGAYYPENGIISGNDVSSVGFNPADSGTTAIYIDGAKNQSENQSKEGYRPVIWHASAFL